MLAFTDFIAPFDPVEFRTAYYGKKPLHIRRQDRAYENPLPWKRFNELLALTPYWNEETLQVFFKSRLALRDNYCDTAGVAPGAKAPTDARKVKALLGLGASLVANQIHRVSPEVDAVAQMLQREFRASVGANVYCSFKQVQAFSTHFDLHDVFAFQAEGEKLWRVYEARADNPVSPAPPGDEAEQWLIKSRGRLLFEVNMRPGDILYLPRGQYHDAVTGDDASLHVTYSVKPATGLSLFKLLEAVAASDSEFRAFLPDARDKSVLAQHLARLAQRLDSVMTSTSFAIDVRNHQRSLASSSANYELPHRQPPRFYSTVKKGQVIRRTDDFAAIFDRAELPLADAHAAVSWLLTQRMFSFEDLAARHPFVDESELEAVLRQLLTLGVIVETEMR